MRVGFSPRKQDFSLYLMPGFKDYAPLLAKLGKHKIGKACLYIKRLEDVDVDTLKDLVRQAWEDMAKRYPKEPSTRT